MKLIFGFILKHKKDIFFKINSSKESKRWLNKKFNYNKMNSNRQHRNINKKVINWVCGVSWFDFLSTNKEKIIDLNILLYFSIKS